MCQPLSHCWTAASHIGFVVQLLSHLPSAEGCGCKTWPGLCPSARRHFCAPILLKLFLTPLCMLLCFSYLPTGICFRSQAFCVFPLVVSFMLKHCWSHGGQWGNFPSLAQAYLLCTHLIYIEDCLNTGQLPACVLQCDFEIPCVGLLSQSQLA